MNRLAEQWSMDAQPYRAPTTLAVQSLQHVAEHGPFERGEHIEDRSRRVIRIASILPDKTHGGQLQVAHTSPRPGVLAGVPLNAHGRRPARQGDLASDGPLP